MALTLALAGDTMLGRGVAEAMRSRRPESLVADDVAAVMQAADLAVLNLECCISDREARWPDPAKPFFFRAPPAATRLLVHLGVDCVTLANNHALDYGEEALLDTLDHLAAAGIAWVGAGEHEAAARAPHVLVAGGRRLAVVAASDHPAAFAAAPRRAGIAYADLRRGGPPGWLLAGVRKAAADDVLVSPHWGPNMVAAPLDYVRSAAAALRAAGATLIAGHSAHVPHGAGPGVLYDLGDFLDDYAVEPRLRNDLGLLFLATLEEGGRARVEARALELAFAHTRFAAGPDAAWVRGRFAAACAALGTSAREEGDRVVVEWGNGR